MKLKIIFSVLSLTLLFDSAFAGERIYGGHGINITDAPYMVQVTRREGRGIHGCGGSILRKDLILTASHCVVNKSNGKAFKAKYFTIYAGSSYKHKGTKYEVKSVHPHPEYKGGEGFYHHDIAILQLKENIKIGDNSQVVEIARSSDKAAAGTKAIVSGWGKNPQNASDKRLYQVVFYVVDGDECYEHHRDSSLNDFNENEICAGDKNHQSCSGDSGGPVLDMKTNRQIGIVSYSDGKCPSKDPKVFSRVSANLDFVESIMSKTRRETGHC